jgi:DNA modification methylase
MTVRQLIGDCRALLPALPDDSVHCVVTSPPYWGLRDYGTAIWDGGDDGCDHVQAAGGVRNNGRDRAASGGKFHDSPNVELGLGVPFRSACTKCGARRIDSQLGLEPTYQEHVDAMVAVFREVRRVLRRDGTLWLNYGDSYATSVNGRLANDTKLKGNDDRSFRDKPFSTIQGGLKPKDLCGIPWRVAFALQADGWWLRQDIIWSKPNPMPESVTDRCTKAHEYLFLLAKSERYFYDGDAIREPYLETSLGRYDYQLDASTSPGHHQPGNTDKRHEQKTNRGPNTLGRNKRSVWHIATAPYSEAHFATFPPALIEPCILAGCPVKACAKCGAPWVREVELTEEYAAYLTSGKAWRDDTGKPDGFTNRQPKGGHPAYLPQKNRTLGFLPSCACDAGTVPGTVLDPFSGAGTTGLVADRLQRNAILIDLNGKYAGMATMRIRGDAPLFADVVTAGSRGGG